MVAVEERADAIEISRMAFGNLTVHHDLRKYNPRIEMKQSGLIWRRIGCQLIGVVLGHRGKGGRAFNLRFLDARSQVAMGVYRVLWNINDEAKPNERIDSNCVAER